MKNNEVLKDWEDSKESTKKILLLVPPKDREIYEKMFYKIITDSKTTSSRKAVQISTIIRVIATKENFHRLMKESKRDFIQVFNLVSTSVGPAEFRLLLKNAYFKMKQKAGK